MDEVSASQRAVPDQVNPATPRPQTHLCNPLMSMITATGPAQNDSADVPLKTHRTGALALVSRVQRWLSKSWLAEWLPGG